MTLFRRTIALAIVVLTFVVLPCPVFAIDSVSRSQIQIQDGVSAAGSNMNVTIRWAFFGTIEKYLVGVLGIIFVGLMLWTAFKLFAAEGKADELKKAWKTLTYAAIGLALVPLSYTIVKILTGLNF